jgi:hypothetical protein
MKSLLERFEEKYIPEPMSGCWIWLGATNGVRGYGKITVKGTYQLAHRIAWRLFNGPINDGAFCLHRCDNPLCVNPQHLSLGTHSDNMEDATLKGRRQIVLANLRVSKLTKAEVNHIRSSQESALLLAGKHKVSRRFIDMIRAGTRGKRLLDSVN